MIYVNNLTKKYQSFCAVNNISFTANPGEILAFLGVNGAGKTTTLRMIAGIIIPSSGEILVDGLNIGKQPEKVKSITGYIPDRPYLYNKLTAWEFLRFIGALYNVEQKTIKSQSEILLKQYSLFEEKDRLIEGFSHGMKQRLATCAALIHDPKILIFDEPMVGLDPYGARFLKKSLRRYAEEGRTVILSTHSLEVAEEVSDRVLIIDKGSIITSGKLEEVKAKNNESLEDLFFRLTQDAY